MVNILASVLALFATACATTAKYEAKLNSWVGSDVSALMTSWGAPSATFDMPNGNKMYIYSFEGGTQTFANYNQFTNQAYAYNVTYWCKTTFITGSDNKILTWKWEGNSCRSRD